MSTQSPRSLRGDPHLSEQAQSEVKSGPHSIPPARVDAATSDVRNLLQGTRSEAARINSHSVNGVIETALERSVEAVFSSVVSDKSPSLSQKDVLLDDIKKRATDIGVELNDVNIPGYKSFMPSKIAIAQAAENFNRLAKTRESTLNRAAFYSVLQVTMQPLSDFVISHLDRLKASPEILKRVLINVEYTTKRVAEVIKLQSIALRSRVVSDKTREVDQPALTAVVSAPSDDKITAVQSIANSLVVKMPIKVMARANAYYDSHKKEEQQLTGKTTLKNIIAERMKDIPTGYQDLRLAFEKAGCDLPYAEMVPGDGVLSLAAKFVRDTPITHANFDTVADIYIASCVQKAMDHFTKQMQKNLPATKVAELQPSIEIFLAKLRISYSHALAIAVRAFMISNKKTSASTSTTSEVIGAASNIPSQLETPAVVSSDLSTSTKIAAHMQQEQQKKVDATQGIISNARKSFRNTLAAAAMSALAGIKDLSSASTQNVNRNTVHPQPTTAAVHATQRPQPVPSTQPVTRQVQEATEVSAITGTVEVSVAGTIQGAINTALHQLNVDSGARTANEPRNALALWASRSHGVTLNVTQLNLLINALTSRIANTEMHAGSHDSPKRAWHAGMPNSKRLRLAYTLGQEPTFIVALLENDPSRAEYGSVTASFSVTPQMLIEGRAWEAITRAAPINSLITENPYDPPKAPIF